MCIKRYHIFNTYYKFNLGNTKFCEILKQELELYPKWDSNDEINNYTEVFIDPEFTIEDKYDFYRNPKNHFYNKDVLGIEFGIKVFWIFKEKKIVIYSNNKEYKFLKKLYMLLQNIQFCLPYQSAGQALHENVFIGDVLFKNDMFILHGSAISTNDGKVVVIGGTGGVGKTSTLLSLGKRKDLFFVCDDLCILNNTGQVFVNYAYPKIYAYNTIGSKEFEKLVTKNDSYLGKFQWKFKKKISGQSSVRRRINPSQLYNIIPDEDLDKLNIQSYIILNRSNAINELGIEKINYKDAVEMSYHIIKNEMNSFYTALNYRKLNALYANEECIYGECDLFYKWKNNMVEVFKNINIIRVDIPFDYNNEKLKEEMSKIICDSLI